MCSVPAAEKVSIIAAPLRNDGSFGPCLQRGGTRHVLVLASTPTSDTHKVTLGAVVPASLRLAGTVAVPLLQEHCTFGVLECLSLAITQNFLTHTARASSVL